MKKALMVLGLFVVGCMADWVCAAAPYAKIEAGLFGGGGFRGEEAGFSFGTERKMMDFSFNYARMEGNLDEPKIQSNGATVHRVGGTIGKILPIGDGLSSLRVALGAGMAISELDGRDKADNEPYGTLGIEYRQIVTENFRFGFYVKGMALRVHTHRTDYGSHEETLYKDGVASGSVEVVDEFPRPESISLNSAIVGVQAVWRY